MYTYMYICNIQIITDSYYSKYYGKLSSKPTRLSETMQLLMAKSSMLHVNSCFYQTLHPLNLRYARSSSALDLWPC